MVVAEPGRYSRQISLPEVGRDGQRRLLEASVLLIGAGGLGSPAALYLAAAGVGRLGLVDHDAVELSNLQRQILHGSESVGRSKLDSARTRIEDLNPNVELVTREARLDSGNALDILDSWDLVIDGSDNFPTRYLVNDACILKGIPFIYGAVLRFEGQASVFGAPGGPCYRCLFRDPPPPGLVPSCAEAGVLGVLPGLVGTIQATEAIKWILDAGDSLVGRLLLIDALRMEFRELNIARDPACPVCGDHPTVTELIDYQRFCGPTEAEDVTSEIDVHELRRRWQAGEPFELIDIREDYEWEICNLEAVGARHVPLGELAGHIDRLPRDRPLVVHCKTGGRGGQATSYLRSLGFDNAHNLTGGILAWAEAHDPGMPTY